MNVLSLFDGISACHLALTKAGFEVDTYYTSEIDKYASHISEHHYPDAIRLGDVTKHDDWDIDWSSIDIVTGGPPCQAFSVAGKRLAFDDERGQLTKTYFEVIKKAQAEIVFMENVTGMLSAQKGEVFAYVLKEFNECGYAVDFIEINSSLVSAQNRKRIYLVGKRIDTCQGLEYYADVTKEFINERKNRINVQGRVVM
jgi:DNA-cytosine methyltransferase